MAFVVCPNAAELPINNPNSAKRSVRFIPQRYYRSPLLINQALLNPDVGIDPTVAQKRPVRPMLVHALPFNVSDHELFAVDRTLGNDLATRRADETLSPELDAVT